MRLKDAELIGNEVVRLLSPACEQVVICGSVRRQKPEVKDLELVALPKRAAGRPVFGEPGSALPPLEALCARLVEWGELRRDPLVKRDGPKYKRFVHPKGKIAIDLFIATPENFGNQIAIRTGDADFSHLLVTHRDFGGLMPPGMFQREGYLWRLVPVDEEDLIPCPDEASFFAELGLPVPDPAHRDAREVARLRAAYPVEAGV